ncbi:MAG: peptidase C39 family protein [Alphaproteobacteria bacterium]
MVDIGRIHAERGAHRPKLSGRDGARVHPRAGTHRLAPLIAAVRPARVEDLDDLLVVEQRCFSTDRLSRASLRRFLRASSARTIVALRQGRIAGYALITLPNGAEHGRLYSFAVVPDARGHGVGRRLLAAAEKATLEAGRSTLRLEVRPDNRKARALYRSRGFVANGRRKNYYQDNADALRMEKILVLPKMPGPGVPYFAQTLDFTCGPAALLMAMAALDHRTPLARAAELQLWRESTLIFMTSGHGGCDPFGLALAADRRGFKAAIFVSDLDDLFLESVRKPEKREVMRLVQRDFRRQLRTTSIVVHGRALRMSELDAFLDAGAIPVMLVSGFRVYRQKIPHWVVVTGADRRYVYLHDPYIWRRNGRTAQDSMHQPVNRHEFQRMIRYGKAKLQAAIILSRGGEKPVRPRPSGNGAA